MEKPTEARIRSAEKLGNSVLVTFDDGKFAVYPASLLRAAIPPSEISDVGDLVEE